MGNAIDYVNYWSQLQEDIRSYHEVCVVEGNFTVTSPRSYKTYYIQKRLIYSQLLFIAIDEESTKVLLKIVTLPSYVEVKSLALYMRKVKDHLSNAGFVKVLDFFFTLEKNKWVFVIVEEFIEGFTLENWLQDLSSDLIASKANVLIPADFAVCAFYDMIGQIQQAHDKGIVLTSISTSNIMLERISATDDPAVLVFEGVAYVTKVAPRKVRTCKVRHQYVPPEGITDRPTYDIWCCGIVLLCVSGK